jgi:hypothetical protein
LSPAIGAHRLLGDGASAALVRGDGEIDWWCTPEMDTAPGLWSLLDPAGASARWRGVRMAWADGPPAGSALLTGLRHQGGSLECWDVMTGSTEGGSALLRLIRNVDADLDVVHDLALGGFDGPWARWTDEGAVLAGNQVVTVRGGQVLLPGERSGPDERWQARRLRAARGKWSALVIGPDSRAPCIGGK